MKINKNIFICAILVAMMLVCVSAVSAEDALDVDLGADASDDAVELSIDDKEGGETLIVGSSSDEILAVDNATVTNATFFDYFDENGVLNNSISVNELIFEGEFSDLGIDTITIDTPIAISNSNLTVFNNIGFSILSDNVILSGIDINRTIDGVAIDIMGSNVTVDDVSINIINPGNEDTFAIRAIESDGLRLYNNLIYLSSGFDASNTNVYRQAVQVRDSSNVIIRKNGIYAELPALDVDYSHSLGVDKDYPLAIGLQNGENITVAENSVVVVATLSSGSYSTLDAVLVEGVKNLEMTDNYFNEIDENGDGKAAYLYAIDLYNLDNALFADNEIVVNSSTGAEASGSVYGMQINGVTTISVDDNVFTSEGRGYAYGIYVSDYYGTVDAEITENEFDITGYAGTAKSKLVTAMELSITNAFIAGNLIKTSAINNYSDDLRLFGICYSSSNKRNHTYTIMDNTVMTDGKYAVFLMNVVDANVTGNVLFAHELYGDDAVYVDSGSNIVEDNIPPFTVTNDTFFNYFDENGAILKDIPIGGLLFEGEFSDLGIDTITIDAPVDVFGENENTKFMNIGFEILSDGVELNNVAIYKENGTAIFIAASDVSIENVLIELASYGKIDSFAIRAVESDNLYISNATIFNEGLYDADYRTYQHTVDIRDSNNVFVVNNKIFAILPPIAVDWYSVGIEQDYPLVVGIQDCENFTLAENNIVTLAYPAYAYTTLDAVMVYNVTNLDIINNNITEAAVGADGIVLYLQAVDIYSSNGVFVCGNNITVNTTSGVDGSGSAYPIQITGYCSIEIDENNLVAISNGPSYGIYASNWAGPIEAIVTNNVIDVTGNASNLQYSLVSGMELVAEQVYISGNDITVTNLNAYSDDNKVYGISNSQAKSGNFTFNVLDNSVDVDGKYAVFLKNVVDTSVVDNVLFAHDLTGDGAVYIDSGDYVVEDNLPVNVITNDTFFNYFDENGVINKNIVATKLVFEGNFSNLGIDAITIDVPKKLVGDYNETIFFDIGFKILSDDVELSDVGIAKINGTAIYIKGSNVTVDGVIIEMISAGVNDSYVIRAVESDNLNIADSIIYYLGEFDANHTTTYQHIIDIRDSNNVDVEMNKIFAILPPITPDFYGVGIDQDFPLVVGIQNCENFTLAENEIEAYAYPAYPYKTLDVVMVNNVTNLAISDNRIFEGAESETDVVLYLYGVDLYNSNGVFVSGNDITVNTTTGIDGSGAAYPIQMTGPLTDVVIDENNLVAISKGPSYGIYASNWGGYASPVEVEITDNVIDVTGNASNLQYSLIAGMVLDVDNASVLGNDITVKNLNAYDETNKAYGISNSQGGNHTFIIMGNLINVDGKYAVYLADSLDSIVTENTLYAHDLEGDEAVNVTSGSAVVEDNCPPFVITNETFFNFFGIDNYLLSHIPEGATLDFQGLFLSDNYTVYINKPVNVISSTGDALFDSNTTNRKWIMFNVVEGADYTNITGINFLNADLFIEAPHVTVDNITAIANMQGVGSGTGFIVFRNDAAYGTIKNSYIENGGTGSSVIVTGYGAPNVTIDNNTVVITGSSGNIMGANAYVGKGVTPGNMIVTNNQIINDQAGAATSYAVTLMGSYNVVENNTIMHKGAGIVNANIQWASGPKDPMENNTYRNNVLIGTGITAAKGSLVENNDMTGALSLAGANITAINNTAGSMTIGSTSDGGDSVVDSNIIMGAVTINSKAVNTTFTNNYLKDTLTVNSNDNVITDNQISTEKAYAVDLKSTSRNTVTDNNLSSADKMGDDAVSYAEGNNNTVKRNGNNAIIEIEVADAWVGNNNTVNVTVVNATGNVSIIINGKEYEAKKLDDEGKVVFTLDASDIEAGLNDIVVLYSGDGIISEDSKDATFYGLDNVVYTEVFFHYFDENGVLKDDVPYSDLIFKGAFAKSSTVKYITINRPVNITGDGATLSQMGIIINSSDVVIDNLALTSSVNNAAGSAFDETLGGLITVNASDVALANLDINYKVTYGDHDAIAINVVGVDDVFVFNSTINFASVVSSDEYYAVAVNLDNANEIIVLNNTITTTLPGLLAENYDWDYFMMGLNTVNPVRIRNVTKLGFVGNSIDSKLNSVGRITPTIQCLMVVGTDDSVFAYNEFKMIDTKSAKDSVIYLYAFNFGYCKNLTVAANDFYLSTNGGKDSAGSAYALQGVESEIYIVGNNITTISNGPNLGIYVASMMGGPSETLVDGNVIDVTGYATSSSSWALISGVEITNGNGYIYNNSIAVKNSAGYVEDAPVYGVSYAQYMYGERSLDVKDNYMDVQGTYAVSVLEDTPANVTDNILYAEKYYGDRAVNVDEGIVENNLPLNAYLFVDFFDIVVGDDAVFIITYDANDTGNVSFIINGKLYEVNTTDGEGQVIISGLDAGTYTFAAYLTEAGLYGPDEYESVIIVDRYETLINITVDDVMVGEDAEVTIDLGNATGSVIAIIDGVEQELPIKRGKATTTIEQIEAGDHSIVVIYGGDDNYDDAFNVTTFTISKYESPISLDIAAAKVGEVSTFTVELPENANGVVMLTINNDSFAISLNMGNSVNVTFAESGIYNVTAVYLGDDYFQINATDVIPVEIEDKAGANIDVDFPEDIKVGDEIVINVTADTDAELIVSINGLSVTLENGTVTYFVNDAGEYEIVVYAPETPEYVEETYITGFEASKLETPISVNVTAAKAGETSTITVELDEFTSGIVIVTVNDENYAIDLNMGNSINVTFTEPGIYNVSAIYLGDDYFESNSSDVTPVEIEDKEISNIFVEIPDDIKVGDTVVINVTTDSDGELYVYIDGELQTIENGTVTYTADHVGKYSLLAGVDETAEYKAFTEYANFEASKIAATVTIKLPENITVEEYMVIGIETNSDAEVVVLIDGNEVEIIGGNVTVYNIAGEHNIVAYVNETVAYTEAIAFDSYNVDKKESSINITANDVYVGETLTVNLTVTEGATGFAIVNVDDETFYSVEFMHSNAASIDVVFDKAGNHTISATYLGNLVFDVANSDEITVVVSDKEVTEANITTPVDFKIGEAANVTVSIPNATGSVTVIVDGKNTTVPLDENGTAVVAIDEITPGEHSVVVVYPGDETHAAIVDSKTFDAPVFPTEFKNITVSGTGFIDAVLVDSYGDPIANATVTYKINGAEANTTTDENGWFYFNATFPATVEIFYAGYDAVLPANASITLNDIAPTRTATSIKAQDYTTYAIEFYEGERGNYFEVQLVDQAGNALANKSVKIGFNGVVYDTFTNATGWAKLQINLMYAGTYTFAVAFLGDNDYNGSFVVQKIIVNKKKTSISASAKSYKASAKTKSYTVTLKTDKGSSIDGKVYMKSGKKVTLKVNGKTYTAKTNSKGQATFKLSISKKGKYSATVKFAGDNTYLSSSKSVKITIK